MFVNQLRWLEGINMKQQYLDILVCPQCGGKLEWHAPQQELWCRSSRLAYPVKDGIPYMLVNEARALTDEEYATV